MNYIIEPIATLPGLLANRKAALGLVDKLADALEQNSDFTGGFNLSRLSKGIELQDVSFGKERIFLCAVYGGAVKSNIMEHTYFIFDSLHFVFGFNDRLCRHQKLLTDLIVARQILDSFLVAELML